MRREEHALRAWMQRVAHGAASRRHFLRTMVGLGLSGPLIADPLATAVPAAAQDTPGAPPAFTPNRRGGGGKLRLLFWQAPTSLNPQLATGVKDFEASRVVYEPLISVHPDGERIPILTAEIPSVENGGRALDGTWTLWRHVQDKSHSTLNRWQWACVFDESVFKKYGQQLGLLGQWESGQEKRVRAGIDGVLLVVVIGRWAVGGAGGFCHASSQSYRSRGSLSHQTGLGPGYARCVSGSLASPRAAPAPLGGSGRELVERLEMDEAGSHASTGLVFCGLRSAGITKTFMGY